MSSLFQVQQLYSFGSFVSAAGDGRESEQRVQATALSILAGEEEIIRQTLAEGSRIGLTTKSPLEEVRELLDEESDSDVEMTQAVTVSAAYESDSSPLFSDTSEDEKPASSLAKPTGSVSDTASLQARIRLGSIIYFSDREEEEPMPMQHPEFDRIDENDVMGWTRALLGVSPSKNLPSSYPAPIGEGTPREAWACYPVAPPLLEFSLPAIPSFILAMPIGSDRLNSLNSLERVLKEEDLIPLLKRFFRQFRRPITKIEISPARKARFVLLVRQAKWENPFRWTDKVRSQLMLLTGEEAGQKDRLWIDPSDFVCHLSKALRIQDWFDLRRTPTFMLHAELMRRIGRGFKR